MIDIPFPCKIVRDFSSEVTVKVLSSGSDSIAEDSLSVTPNAIGEVIEISWVNLTYENVIGLEYWLQKTRATERILWDSVKYLLEDEYSVEVGANKPIVKARLRRVS